MIENYKNYPEKALTDSYSVKTGEGIDEGMFVKLNVSGKLVKANGTPGEYAMPAMNIGSDRFLENANKIDCAKENCSLATSYYKAGVPYIMHGPLQVSSVVGEEGVLTIHDGSVGRPIAGRYLGMEIQDIGGQKTSLLVFDLVRT